MIDSPTTSLSLLDRLAVGDGDAWGRIVQLYSPLMRSWLRPHRLQPADMDDLVQNALSVAVRRLPEYRHNGRTGAFRSWLRAVIANVVRETTRARRPDFASAELLAELEDPASDLNRRWDADHDSHVLRTLCALVRPEFAATTWAAFRRTTIDGISPVDVAAELGVTVSAVYLARSRVLARLRREADGFLDAL